MKYIVILGDGMADLPIKELGNKTPLQYAHKPNMDFIARNGALGLVKTVPDDMAPASDIANLSVLGYDPNKYYTGRSPLEAVNIGVSLSPTDVALRCNFVTLSNDEPYLSKTLLDYCADEITTSEADELIKTLNESIGSHEFSFFTGTSYRHCTLWKNGQTGLGLTPPHDITGNKITNYIPDSEISSKIIELMQKSYPILVNHPINVSRINRGLSPANSIWLWGEGRKPSLPLFKDLYKVSGSMVSAVDLLKGIASCAGLSVINVEGATGNIHTNFLGKAEAALRELECGKDFVFIHIEAPDECGHRGELQNKIKSIELIDEKVLGFLLPRLNNFDDYKILLLPDHPTPISLKTHTKDPVPYVIYQKSKAAPSNSDSFDEISAGVTGLFKSEGHTLMASFLNLE